MAFAEKGCFSSALQSLSSRRINLGYHLCSDCWCSPSEQDQNSSGQRRFSTDCRFKKLPIFQQSKTFLKKNQSRNHSEHQQSSRSFKVKDVLSAPAPYQYPLRFGLFRSYPLRQINSRGQGRLQPSQERRSFLPSLALFRVPFQRLLARHLKTRRCFQFHGLSRILKNLLSQSSSPSLSYSPPSRCWFLRPQVYRGSGGEKYWLLYRSQDDQSYQKQSGMSSLSPVQEKLGSSPVFLSTLPVEETTSFCSNQATSAGRRLRSIYSLYRKALCLSGLCNQSSLKSRKNLVFLQVPSSRRSPHQGTERKLCFSQNSNQQLSGQSGLFFFAPFCLQYRQLVQESLFASKISECYLRNHSDRVLGITSQISQNRPSECTQITGRIYFRANIGTHYSEN